MSLRNNSEQKRRIDDMDEDVEKTSRKYLKTCRFSNQHGESTMQNNEALLLSYVRFIEFDSLVFDKFIEITK